MIGSNAAFVAKWGASSFVSKAQAQKYPAFSALSLAIDDFVKTQNAAKEDSDKAKNTAAFFDRIKSLVSDDVHGLQENQFTGYYSVQLKESLAQCQEFFDWCDGTAMPAYREAWLTSQTDSRFASTTRASALTIDPKSLAGLERSPRCRVSLPTTAIMWAIRRKRSPRIWTILFWIIEDPQGARRTIAMHQTNGSACADPAAPTMSQPSIAPRISRGR